MIQRFAWRILAPILLAMGLLATPALAKEVCVNIHSAEPGYPDAKTILRAMSQISIRCVRTGVPSKPRGINGDLADAGITMDVVANGKTPPDIVVARVAAFQTAHPGSITSIELPNEVNNAPLRYKGLADKARPFPAPLGYYRHYDALILYAADLKAEMLANPVTRGLPLIGTTGMSPYEAEFIDIANLHQYPKPNPATIRVSFAKAINAEVGGIAASELPRPGKPKAGVPPFAPRHAGLPFDVTETGFSTVGVVGEQRQADYLITSIKVAFEFGAGRVFVYQLFDGWADGNPAKPNALNHYGLFHNDGTPKLSAIALGTYVAGTR